MAIRDDAMRAGLKDFERKAKSSLMLHLHTEALFYFVLVAMLAVTPGTVSMGQSKAGAPVKSGRGASFRDCPHCPEMVVIPAGSFLMGSPPAEPKREAYEGPLHQVTITAPFAAGKFAVTFAEWDACVADGGCNGYQPNDAGWGRQDRPVINVRWDDAKAYTAWLSKKTGKAYRLLSEAEREYVTRAGTATLYWFGGKVTIFQARHDGGGENGQKTAPVKSFDPNPWGLYQVHGNVWEWVEDCWHDNYEGAPADGSAWTDGSCNRRVLRGGSWGSASGALRAAFRTSYFPGLRDAYTGFRVATSAPAGKGRS
jgi:formylglycine-generating enzyme required for sulfatase activity